ncbi:hypothetical protein C8R43DRAFT_961164 [Mycena crocata]|nr:hypothetical protein C8R43DRAFT_961164 [Mycena crocata]
MNGGHNTPHPRPFWAPSSGPCASSRIFEPQPPVHVQWPFEPGLRFERSPYTCIPPPNFLVLPNGPYEPDIPPRTPHIRPVALPAQITRIAAIKLNPVLRFSDKTPGSARLDVDLAGTLSDVVGLNGPVLEEPATYPGLPSLTVLCPHLPWSITVHASGGWVTVGDVIHTILGALRIRVTEDQFDEWVMTEFPCQRVGRGLERRRAYDSGMTRLGFLQGKHVFAGLSDSDMRGEVIAALCPHFPVLLEVFNKHENRAGIVRKILVLLGREMQVSCIRATQDKGLKGIATGEDSSEFGAVVVGGVRRIE